MMVRTPTTVASVVAACLMVFLGGCGGSDEPTGSSSSSATSSSGASDAVGGGTAKLVFAGTTQSFVLANCQSKDTQSIDAAGDNAEYAITIDAEGGEGSVLVASLADIQDTIEGSTLDLGVSATGAFTATGTYQAANSVEDFSLTGACESVNWG